MSKNIGGTDSNESDDNSELANSKDKNPMKIGVKNGEGEMLASSKKELQHIITT